ncbi:MAG: hypothetical protein M9921_04145 [Fimbriimonadaceae bacterium]|nr:hypothetical protein [Chthonomonadaceae bacterium]MCO5296026.1 hypothetical protein [Fimbriimonadaceae bacterium]
MRTALLLLLALAGVGCGSTDSTEASGPPVVKHDAPDLPEAWQEVSVAGVRLGLPQGFAVVDLTRADLDEAFKEFSIPGEAGAAMVRQTKEMAKQGLIKFVAFGEEVDGFRENVNLNVIPAVGATLEKVRDEGVQAMASVTKNLKSQVLSDPARVEISGDMTAQGPAGPFTYRIHAQQFLHNGKLYTITFSFPPSRESVNLEMANQVLKVVRFD